MYKSLFSKTFEHLNDKLPFQAHSHHFWPDIALDGIHQYWNDSTGLIDDKWEKIFSEVIPQAQNLVTNMLDLDSPKQVVFGNNTHELIYRFLTSFKFENLRILTTDSEFYSLDRQLRRLKEEKIHIHNLTINNGSSSNIKSKILQQVEEFQPNVLIFSQCFFNSGYYISQEDIESIVLTINPEIQILIDGYHSFATRPISLKTICKRAYFTSGGYKYAMSGEGVCFLVTPLNSNLRPLFTGWMAEIEKLDNMETQEVFYPKGASRFLGSTFDPSGLYRFNAVWTELSKKSITLDIIHKHVKNLQKRFLVKFKESPFFSKCNLLISNPHSHAHFFAIDCQSHENAELVFNSLKEKKVLCDKRKSIIRFGFSIYQELSDIDELFNRLSKK